MAKLSAHGPEFARWQTTADTDVPGDLVVRQYSLREDGYILVKTKLDGYRGWSAWRIYGCYPLADVGHGLDVCARRFRRVLDRKLVKVEEIA